MNAWQLFVIPEDGNLQEVVEGFFEGLEGLQSARWKLLKVGSRPHTGWQGAVDSVGGLNLAHFPKRHVLLVIDRDHNDPGGREREVDERLEGMGLKAFRERIHLLTVCRQSEDLLGIDSRHWGESGGPEAASEKSKFQQIGECLARKCLERDETVWSESPILNANWEERERMRKTVCVNLMIPMGREKDIRS